MDKSSTEYRIEELRSKPALYENEDESGVRQIYRSRCVVCGDRECNGQCFGDDMMGDS